MISIPNFGTGAMENWGLITYRETNLLWDPVESSTYNKQRVAAVVAHELVHQVGHDVFSGRVGSTLFSFIMQAFANVFLSYQNNFL